MKKSLILLVATCMFVAVNAQTDAGGKFIGGTIKFGTASFFNPDSVGYFKGNNFDFQIAPEFGYFVADNFAIGASLFFGTSTEKMRTITNASKNPAAIPIKKNFDILA